MARSSARDMFFTMAVFAIPLALIVWFFQSAGQPAPQVPEADWKSAVARATKAKSFPVMAPADPLPEGWRATKARWLEKGQPDGKNSVAAGDTLELGFLSPDDEYFALNQTIAPTAPYVTKVTRQGWEAGFQKVGDKTWTEYQSADDRTHSLGLVEGRVTTVVVSDADVEKLKRFAAMLTVQG